MITRDEFNASEHYYFLTSVDKVRVVANKSQYFVEVFFNTLNEKYNPTQNNINYTTKKLVDDKQIKIVYPQHLNYYVFKIDEATKIIYDQSLLFSLIEFPNLVIGTIWHKGRIIHNPKNFFMKKDLDLDFKQPLNYQKIVKPEETINYPKFLSESLWRNNVFSITQNNITYLIPVYEAIRAFYCESSSISDSCFNGKSVFHRILTNRSRFLNKLKKDEGYIVLEKHIEDARAALAFRMYENDNYYYQFCKVRHTIMDKNNNGPLIKFPIDWPTKIKFCGFHLTKNTFLVNFISSYEDYTSKYSDFNFGRVNDGRKGGNSKDLGLIKKKSKKINPIVLEIDTDTKIVDSTGKELGYQEAPVVTDLITKNNSSIQVKKIDKTIQIYKNDEGSLVIKTDDEMKVLTTDNGFQDGSEAGGLHLHEDEKFLELNFKERIQKLQEFLSTQFTEPIVCLRENEGYYQFLTLRSDNWCFMKKEKGVFRKEFRKIGILFFKEKSKYCYIFEIQNRPTEADFPIGIAVSSINLTEKDHSTKIGVFLKRIRKESGHLENIKNEIIVDFKFSSVRHNKDYKKLAQAIKVKIDNMLINA